MIDAPIYNIDGPIVQCIRQKGWWILSFECCYYGRTRIFDCIFELTTGPFYFENERGELVYPRALQTFFTVHLSSHEDAMMIYLALK